MRPIPLLLSASPRTAKESAWVPVRFDRWKVVVEGLDDTVLILHHDSGIFGVLDEEELFIGQRKVKIEIKEPGSERYISVFAVPFVERK